MGINAIRCKGVYEEAGKTGFGEGSRSASDFDGLDLLLTGSVVATVALGGALMAMELAGNGKEAPKGPTESAKIEYGPYHFNASGENKTVHSQFSNKTYQIELEKIYHGSDMTLMPIIIGDSMALMPISNSYHIGHFNVTDIGTMEKTQIAFRDASSVDLSGNMSVHASVGSDIAELTLTEKYAIPLKE